MRLPEDHDNGEARPQDVTDGLRRQEGARRTWRDVPLPRYEAQMTEAETLVAQHRRLVEQREAGANVGTQLRRLMIRARVLLQQDLEGVETPDAQELRYMLAQHEAR